MFFVRRFVCRHLAHLHPPGCVLPSPGQIGALALPTEDRGESSERQPLARGHFKDFKRSLSFPPPPLSPPQATVFLIVGVVFMIGSLSLIVLDWIHNPPGSSGGH